MVLLTKESPTKQSRLPDILFYRGFINAIFFFFFHSQDIKGLPKKTHHPAVKWWVFGLWAACLVYINIIDETVGVGWGKAKKAMTQGSSKIKKDMINNSSTWMSCIFHELADMWTLCDILGLVTTRHVREPTIRS